MCLLVDFTQLKGSAVIQFFSLSIRRIDENSVQMRRIITFNISVISARLKMTGLNNRILFRAPLGTVVGL
jgi:hypothetical protein